MEVCLENVSHVEKSNGNMEFGKHILDYVSKLSNCSVLSPQAYAQDWCFINPVYIQYCDIFCIFSGGLSPLSLLER